MIENFSWAALYLLDPAHMALLIGAVLMGIIVGAAPGLTSTMAIGLLIPLTFGLSKYIAFILMLGIYCGAIYGGSIPAILFNIPGTPTAAVTAIDGYPLSKRGEGGKALGVATLSSTLGGLISCLVLIALSTYLAKIAVAFGPAEYLTLTIFALCVVFSLASKSILKGIASAAFGLMLACIGMDPIAQSPRFTFGLFELMVGIPMVPATIGMFCVAEAFRIAEQPELKLQKQHAVSGINVAFKIFPKLWKTILRSSGIGVLIGTLPGTGAMMASFMAYGEARRNSDTPEEFGNGAIEGVCASESANNAVTGGAMVPLLSLGIPGDPNTLMMLGAMTVQGLIPGPILFKEEGHLLYVIFGSLILANLFILPAGLFLSQYFAKAAQLNRKYLMPLVAVLSITGASIGYGHIYYFWISVIFGILGYFLHKAGFSVLAVTLALMLGPTMERYLRSLFMMPDNSGLTLLLRPIPVIFILGSIVVIVVGVYKNLTAELIDNKGCI